MPRFEVTTNITAPPQRVFDEQGGTLMRDVVAFAAPLGGPLGVVAEFAVLNWYMPRLISIRNDHIKAVAEATR